MSSISGSGECASLAYLGGGLDILNLNTTHCFDPPDAQGDDSACSMYWFSNASDVRSLAAPSFEHSDIIWRFRNASDLLGDLPLSKPLVIDCPMPLCVFPISGPFSELQRYLLYLNFLVALLAIPLRLIRDISQLFLVSNGVAAFIYFLKIYALHNRPIVDLDFLPTMVYTATGLLVSLIWCSLRAPGKIKTPAHMALYFMSPHLAAFFGIIGCMLTTAFYYSGWHPSAVVLESPASFRLTSPCYRESNGTISFWTVDFSYPIRRLDELQIVLPPDNRGSAASPWTAFPIPLTKLYSGFWAMLSAVVGTWIVQGLLYRAGIFTVNRNQYNWASQSGHGWLRDLQLLIHHLGGKGELFLLIQHVGIYFLGWVVLVASLEHGIHTEGSAQSESRFQFGQWGSWINWVFVGAGTVVLNSRYLQGEKTVQTDRE